MLFGDGRGAGEDIELGLVVVVLVVLGEDAHADLVEGRGGEGGEGFLLHFVALVGPGVAGGAEGEVGVCRRRRRKWVPPRTTMGAVRVGGGGGDGECAPDLLVRAGALLVVA